MTLGCCGRERYLSGGESFRFLAGNAFPFGEAPGVMMDGADGQTS